MHIFLKFDFSTQQGDEEAKWAELGKAIRSMADNCNETDERKQLRQKAEEVWFPNQEKVS